MPIVQDNNFVHDFLGIRAERLNSIQGNFASIQPELSAPANIATWAVDCYDVYSQLGYFAQYSQIQSHLSAVALGAPVGGFSFKGNHPGSPIIRSVTAGKRKSPRSATPQRCGTSNINNSTFYFLTFEMNSSTSGIPP